MPNWVRNIVKFDCPHDKFMEIVRNVCRDDSGLIDFQKIEPIPESEEGNWYDWNIEHWGTKWNASIENPDDLVSYLCNNTLCFETPWTTPDPIIRKLSLMYPGIDINCRYADDDFGYNCGMYRCNTGKLTVLAQYGTSLERKSVEGVNFAINVWGYKWAESAENDLKGKNK